MSVTFADGDGPSLGFFPPLHIHSLPQITTTIVADNTVNPTFSPLTVL